MHDYMYSIQERLLDPTEDEEIIPLGKEFHAILSGAKPILSWLARDGIKEYKEVHRSTGYLTVSELGNTYNSNDPNTTFEGDNDVLIQQTSNWLLQVWSAKLRGETIDYPLLSVSYLNDAPRILQRKFAVTNLEDFVKPQCNCPDNTHVVIAAYCRYFGLLPMVDLLSHKRRVCEI